jgi:hypothetical protein
MSLAWQPHDYWHARSADGYYAVRKQADPYNTAEPYEANHIPMLWARAKPIGTAATLEGAQAICDHHSKTTKPFDGA